MEFDKEGQRKIFLIATGVLLGVLIIIGVIFATREPPMEDPADDPADGSSIFVPEGQLLINDMYSGRSVIPLFDIELNEYDAEKFVEKDGFLTYDSSSARIGVDVSEHQGDIDWQQVKDAGMDFAFLRLGYRGMTKGFVNEDKTFEQNLSGATDAGLFVGVYFFSQAVTESEAIAEAEFVLETLEGRKLAYPIVFDWEQPATGNGLSSSDLRAYDVTGEEATAFAKAFCERIEQDGYKAAVYTNKYMAYNFFDLAELNEYDLWYAEYQPIPSLYYDFRIWQYTETGSVPGIDGGVDINICFEPY